MIYVNFTGRCGNQLFQYAFARKLSVLNGDTNFVFDFYHVNRVKNEKTDESFKEELNSFNVLPYQSCVYDDNNVTVYGSKKQQRLYKRYPFVRKVSYKLKMTSLLQKFQFSMQKNGIYKEDECALEPVKCKSKDIFVRGYFENPAYFADIKSLLFQELTPRFPKKDKNKELYRIIESTESVCVSFRVWNEIANDGNLLKQRDVCTKDYYIKAIEKMHELHPNAHFIIFSNDIEWVKSNIHFSYSVSFEDGDDEVWEKLRLMYSCKHFIMSTSTFCWWAQYLSRNDNKTVISPNKWYSDNKQSFLLDDSWIKIV